MDWDRDEYIRANTNAATITALEKYATAHEEISQMLPTWEAMTDEDLATEHVRILALYEAAYVIRSTQGLNSHEEYADAQLWRAATEKYFTKALDRSRRIHFVQIRAAEAAVVQRATARRSSDLAEARWSRLDPVKELAFKRRGEMPHLSRAAAIEKMKAEIVKAAKDAGEPLSGGNPARTIADWCRRAKIK